MPKKTSEPFKLRARFGRLWSEEYNGQWYNSGSRDLRSAKEYLEMNPDFFEDEAQQTDFDNKVKRYLKDKFWYKPYGNPPMFHPLYCFLNNIEKYANAVKKFEQAKKIIPKEEPPAAPEVVKSIMEEWKKSIANQS